MNICSPCSGDFAFVKYLCLGCLEDVALGNTRMLVYMAPRSYSSLGNTRMLKKFTKVSHTFLLFIHATKITNVWLQQHNHFLEWEHCPKCCIEFCLVLLTIWVSRSAMCRCDMLQLEYNTYMLVHTRAKSCSQTICWGCTGYGSRNWTNLYTSWFYLSRLHDCVIDY